MLGTQNQPALVGYRLKAIWDLPIFNNEIYYPNAKKNLLNGLKNIDQAAIKCGKQHCGGLGICAIKQSFWTLFEYKKWNSNSKYDDIWDPEICLNQYNFGHSLMKSGSNIRTQMNQCNSSDQVLWGERYESSVIRFDPFCVNKMQIAIGLNLINRSVDYAATLSDVENDRFKITYGLLGDERENYCTEIGGVSYAMFCQDTIVRVNLINSNEQTGTSVTIIPEPKLDCTSYDDGNIHAITVLSGYNYTSFADGEPSYRDTIRAMAPVSRQPDKVTFEYEMGTKIQDKQWINISIISFCNDKSSIRYGEEVVDFVGRKGKPSPYLYRKWIKFDKALTCITTNVFIAISGIDDGIDCQLGVWAENESGAGFSMVVGIWDSLVQNKNPSKTAKLNCLFDRNKARFQWMATCQDL